MKNKILVLALVSGIFFSCKKKEEQLSTDELKQEVPQEPAASTQECYEYTQGKDTIQANIRVQGENVNGNLVYNLFGKDKNTGTIVGTINGDTLQADYKFVSEGKESIREVVFLRKNNMLLEGYGESEVQEDGAKTVFKSMKDLNFTSSLQLLEAPCK